LRAGVWFVVGEKGKREEAEEEVVGVVFVNLKKPTKGPARVELPPQQQRGLSFFSATT
jgi:D-aminopeptidase